MRVAQANYDSDKKNYERYQKLYDQGAIAWNVLDAAETKMKVSKAQLESAQQQSSLVLEGSRTEEIKAAQAVVEQADAGVNSARANLKQVDVANANVEIERTTVKQAEAALTQARSARQTNIMRDKDVRAAQAMLAQAGEAVATAEQTLDETRIYSPVDGVDLQRKSPISGKAWVKTSPCLGSPPINRSILRPMCPNWRPRACAAACR